MAALKIKWSLLALTALLSSPLCSAYRATPIPFNAVPTPYPAGKLIPAATVAPPSGIKADPNPPPGTPFETGRTRTPSPSGKLISAARVSPPRPSTSVDARVPTHSPAPAPFLAPPRPPILLDAGVPTPSLAPNQAEARGPTPAHSPAPAPFLAPPRPPILLDAGVPTPSPAPVLAPATGPTPAPDQARARGPTPTATGSVPSPTTKSEEMPPEPLPTMKNDTRESKIAVNCCGGAGGGSCGGSCGGGGGAGGGSWGSPGCGGTPCPGGGCGAGPCPTVPKNPYYCQPAGCGGNSGYGCGGNVGFTIYMGDHFPSAASGVENKS